MLACLRVTYKTFLLGPTQKRSKGFVLSLSTRLFHFAAFCGAVHFLEEREKGAIGALWNHLPRPVDYDAVKMPTDR